MVDKPKEFLDACNGNKDAVRFCDVFVDHCHVLDDIIDEDNPVTDETLIKSQLDMMLELTLNPFFVANKSYLMPLSVQSFNAWLDSNDWEDHADERFQRGADVLKGFYHEVVYGVIYLCSGFEGLRKATKENREYDFDFKEKD